MIKLEFFQPLHMKQLIEWIRTPELLMQWGGPAFQYPLDEKQLEDYLHEANKPDSTSYIYSVLSEETEELIGHISLSQIDRKHESARIGKVLVGKQRERGRGVGAQMVEEIVGIAFEELKLHRVSLGVFDFNHSAISCYEKVGFQKEGLLRDYRKCGNEFWSLWEMSILKHEWQQKHDDVNKVLN
ncbi:GNAT family N-acetyltransferase [Metabacillus sp. HB246100]